MAMLQSFGASAGITVLLAFALASSAVAQLAPVPDDGSALPFPPTPSASVAGATLQDSAMTWRKEPQRLKPDAPNVLIVLIDDVGFGIADTFGGEVHTPTLSRLANEGISYNRFHTTSICSPTRAALLTGRNHHRVGNGSIAERASDFNGYTGIIPKTSATIAEVLHHCGLDVLGSAKVDNMYHAGWAWAGSVPFRSTKPVAAHFGGTRNPMAISWPQGIKPDKTPRAQFHHVNDIPPTLYEVIGIKQPQEVNGFQQDPMDGVSMVYTFADAHASGQKTTQYFENNASRGIYHDGWFACTFGPFIPWDTPGTAARLAKWDANKDEWELYDLTKDFSQADNLAAKEPERLATMQELFLREAKANKALPIGGGLWTRFHPEDIISPLYMSWRFDATATRMPAFTAPGLGKKSNTVIIDVEVGQNDSGVLYALGGASGGLTLSLDQGQLVYEYNMMIIERYIAKSQQKLAPGKHTIGVDTTIAKPGAPADVVLTVDGSEVARTTVTRTVPAAFTASETFDVGIDLGSPVSRAYFDRGPFKFEGKIDKVEVKLK
jgi:Sulfatase